MLLIVQDLIINFFLHFEYLNQKVFFLNTQKGMVPVFSASNVIVSFSHSCFLKKTFEKQFFCFH